VVKALVSKKAEKDTTRKRRSNSSHYIIKKRPWFTPRSFFCPAWSEALPTDQYFLTLVITCFTFIPYRMKPTFPHFLILGLLLICFCANAQVTATIGAEINNDRKNAFNKMLGSDETNFYVYRYKKEGVHFLEKYDSKTLGLVSSNLVEFTKEDETKDMRILDIVFTNGKYFVFKYYRDKSIKTFYYCYEVITKDGIGSNDVVYYEGPLEMAEIKIDYNIKKTKIGIAMTFYAGKEQKIISHLFCIDTQSRKVWDKEGLSYPATDYTTYGTGPLVYVDEFDNVHFKTYKKKVAANPKEEVNYEGLLSTFNLKTNTVRTVMLDIAYSKFKMYSPTDGELYLAGFLGEKYDHKAKGQFNELSFIQIKINTKTGTISTTEKKLDPSLMEALEAYKNRDLLYYTRDFYMIGQDTYVIGEQLFVRPDHNQAIDIPFLHTAVLITKLNEKKEVEWIRQVPTLFYTYNNKQIITAYTDKTFYIFNNEHEDNLALVGTPNIKPADLKEAPLLFRSTNFVYTSFSLLDGKLNQHGLVFPAKEYFFFPKQAWGRSAFCIVQNIDLSVPIDKKAFVMHTGVRSSGDEFISRFYKVKFE